MARDFLDFLERLNHEGLEFVIVGGVAARLYGSTRLTHDVDIVPRLSAKSWRDTITCIEKAGGKPRIPETMETIADVRNVRKWIAEKGMLAVCFRSDDGFVEIDLLVAESPRFKELKKNATEVRYRGSTYFIASLEDLIAMKLAAGRPQDLLDVEELKRILIRARNLKRSR